MPPRCHTGPPRWDRARKVGLFGRWHDIADRVGRPVGELRSDAPQRRALFAFALAICAVAIGLGAVVLAAGRPIAATIPLAFAAASLLNVQVHERTNRLDLTRRIQVVLALTAPFALQLALGGAASSGVMGAWACIALVGSAALCPPRELGVWVVLFLAGLVGVVLLDGVAATLAGPLPGRVSAGLFLVNVAGGPLLAVAQILALIHQRDEALREVQASRDELVAAMVGMHQANAALADSAESARRTSEAKGRWVAHVSHELRNPLQAVVGMADLLQTTSLDARQRQYVNTLWTATRAVLDLIDRLLDHARIDADALNLDLRPSAPTDWLEDAVRLFDDAARRKGLLIRTVTTEGAPQVLIADPIRCRQVLINLVANAVKFTESGSVEVRYLPITNEYHDLVGAAFEVEDTGIGIAPEAIGRLMQPFQQESADTARRYGGTGLGLAIARGIADAHGGALSVRSESGRGSVFRLELPLVGRGATPENTTTLA